MLVENTAKLACFFATPCIIQYVLLSTRPDKDICVVVRNLLENVAVLTETNSSCCPTHFSLVLICLAVPFTHVVVYKRAHADISVVSLF